MKLNKRISTHRIKVHSSRYSMKTRFIKVTIALIFVLGSAVAVENSRAGSLVAVENTRDSVVAELSEIVVLCATEKEKKFKKEWSRYVAHNDLKGASLQETISWVSDEAAMQRKHTVHSDSEENDDEVWKAEQEELMNELARQAMLR